MLCISISFYVREHEFCFELAKLVQSEERNPKRVASSLLNLRFRHRSTALTFLQRILSASHCSWPKHLNCTACLTPHGVYKALTSPASRKGPHTYRILEVFVGFSGLGSVLLTENTVMTPVILALNCRVFPPPPIIYSTDHTPFSMSITIVLSSSVNLPVSGTSLYKSR